MQRTLIGAALWLALVTMAGSARAADKLPSDSRNETGVLDNGVHWIFRAHDNPPGKVALMLHVETGSLNETEQQRGLAHFMEHMMFNGTQNFGPGELIPYFEKIGMEFGADLNAFTSFDQTSYMLFLPDTKEETIREGLEVLSDMAFHALLLPDEIEKERGVVLEEKRAGSNAGQRIRDELWPRLFSGSRLAARLPIGLEDVLKHADREQFEDYYRTWYRPENMTMIVVGDTTKEKVVPLIQRWFGQTQDLPAAREAKTPELKPFTEQQAIVVTDPEQSGCDIQVIRLAEGKPPTTTVAQLRDDLVTEIANWIVSKRLDDLRKQGKVSYLRAGVSTQSLLNDGVIAAGSATAEPKDWEKALSDLLVEISRARAHGFNQRELDLAKKELTADAERSVRTESTQNARGLLMQINASIADEEPVLSAQQYLDQLNTLLPTIKLDDVTKRFDALFQPSQFAFVMAMPSSADVPSESDVLAAARAALARTTEAKAEQKTADAILATLPTPGKVVDTKTDSDLGVTHAWLSNGVRVHHRFMDYKKDTAYITISLVGGEIEETADNAGVTQVALLAVNQPATSKLSSTEIEDLMTGKNVRVRAGSDRDSILITVSGSPKDLESGMQLAYALLTDGKIEQPAFDTWQQQQIQQLNFVSRLPQFRGFAAMVELVTGNDPRLTFPDVERVEKQTRDAGQAWFDRIRKTGPIEVAVVGEIEQDEAMKLVTQYVGSLPERPRTADLGKLRTVDRKAGPWERHETVQTITPQGFAAAGFIGPEAGNTDDRRAIEAAIQVLSSRLVKRIREDLSLVYSIRAFYQPSWAIRGVSLVAAGSACDPANAKQVTDEVQSIYGDFAKNGPTAEELENAKKQIVNNLDDQMKEPSYWLNVLQTLDLHHRDLALEKTRRDSYNDLTPEQVRDVFSKYYQPDQRLVVTAVPGSVDSREHEDANEDAAMKAGKE